MVLLIESFECIVLGCQSALCGSIDDQEDLALIFGQRYIVALLVFNGKIVNAHVVSSRITEVP